MDPMTDVEVAEAAGQAARYWWLFLCAGLAWVVVSIVVLSVHPGTPALIGYMTAFVLIAAGVNEFFAFAVVGGWRWLHVALGVLFLITGIMALMAPFQTFGVLALFIGWYLVFKGTVDIILSIVERDALHLWGLILAAGIIEVVIGVWAIGYPGRSAWLLIVWIGITALMRGITEIVVAFKLRGGSSGPAQLAVA